MPLNPMHLTVAKLLEGRLFRIPEYQRSYSWKTRQREDLFGDIQEAARSGREHFMATVVALGRETRTIAADEYTTVELVDGQQRITTLVLLLKAIEKALGDGPGEARSKRDLGDLLVKGDAHSLLLLQTNHDLGDVFTRYVRSGLLPSGPVSTAADQNLVDAVHECEAFVREWALDGGLVDLLGTVRNRLSMLFHELDEEAVVYRVFEVLNSRGLDVKWLDKTKSQLMAAIFEHVETGSRNEVLREMQTVWGEIYRKLGLRDDLGDEALRFAGTWSIIERPNRILAQEDASLALSRRAGTRATTIVEAASWLRRVVGVVEALNADPRRVAVTRISHARFLAAAILLRDFERGVEDDLLGLWERVTFRIFGLGGADTRNKVGQYVRLGHDVLVAAMTPAEIREGLEGIGADHSIDDLLDDEDFWSNCYEGWSEELRYLLYRYEEHLVRSEGGIFNATEWRRIWAVEPSKSIEHIAPQSAAPEWVHHVGNLTMLPPSLNSALRDKPPVEKAPRYVDCGLRDVASVGREIIGAERWTKAMVMKRAATIERFVRQEWGD